MFLLHAGLHFEHPESFSGKSRSYGGARPGIFSRQSLSLRQLLQNSRSRARCGAAPAEREGQHVTKTTACQQPHPFRRASMNQLFATALSLLLLLTTAQAAEVEVLKPKGN